MVMVAGLKNWSLSTRKSTIYRTKVRFSASYKCVGYSKDFRKTLHYG